MIVLIVCNVELDARMKKKGSGQWAGVAQRAKEHNGVQGGVS
jgi:hypothetical protein